MTIMMIIIVAEQILQSTEQRDKNPAERKSGGRVEEEGKKREGRVRKSGGRVQGWVEEEWGMSGGMSEGRVRKSGLQQVGLLEEDGRRLSAGYLAPSSGGAAALGLLPGSSCPVQGFINTVFKALVPSAFQCSQG